MKPKSFPDMGTPARVWRCIATMWDLGDVFQLEDNTKRGSMALATDLTNEHRCVVALAGKMMS